MNGKTEINVLLSHDKAQIAMLCNRISALEAELERCKMQCVKSRKTERDIAVDQLPEFPEVITHGVGSGVGIGGIVSDILFGEIRTTTYGGTFVSKSGDRGCYKRRLVVKEMTDDQYAIYADAVSRIYKVLAEIIMEHRGEELRRRRMI